MPRKFYTIKEAQFVEANYLKMTDREMGEAIGKDAVSIQNFRTRNKLVKPLDFNAGRFVKGQKSWNTGKSFRFSPATEFKKGQLPKNTKEDGAISIRTGKNGRENYKYIRVGLAKWVLLHRQIWEQAYGAIPPGYVVTFRNKDTLDCRLENLEMISRAESVRRNANRKKASETMKGIWRKIQILEANGRPTPYKLKSKYHKRATIKSPVLAIPLNPANAAA